jgi:hypothetical protein
VGGRFGELTIAERIDQITAIDRWVIEHAIAV